MGCSQSASTKHKPRDSELSVNKFITEREKEIVKETWAIVALDLPSAGLFIFTRLFEMQKDLKKLFRRMMTQNESGEYIFDPQRLERHAVVVMKGLGQAVENVDDSEYFSEMLHVLGEKHIAFNVRPEMMTYLWPAIRDGLRTVLGEKFTAEGELAWKHMYDYVSFHMIYGMEHGSGGQQDQAKW